MLVYQRVHGFSPSSSMDDLNIMGTPMTWETSMTWETKNSAPGLVLKKSATWDSSIVHHCTSCRFEDVASQDGKTCILLYLWFRCI